MAATFVQTQKSLPSISLERLSGLREKTVEGFWLLTCLALFVLLGPFSAPIVLGYLIFSNDLQSEAQEPESLNP